MLTDLKDAFHCLDQELETHGCQTVVTIQHLDVEDDGVIKKLIINYTLPYGNEEILEQYIVDMNMDVSEALVGFKDDVLSKYKSKYYDGDKLEAYENIKEDLKEFDIIVLSYLNII